VILKVPFTNDRLGALKDEKLALVIVKLLPTMLRAGIESSEQLPRATQLAVAMRLGRMMLTAGALLRMLRKPLPSQTVPLPKLPTSVWVM